MKKYKENKDFYDQKTFMVEKTSIFIAKYRKNDELKRIAPEQTIPLNAQENKFELFNVQNARFNEFFPTSGINYASKAKFLNNMDLNSFLEIVF